MDRLQRVALGEDARIQDQRQQRVTDSGSQQMAGNSPHLDFQDSNLSPALSLLPSNSGLEHNFSEYSLFQHSEMEFVPLRAYPDISMASERFHIPPQDLTTRTMERASLSQHPLAQENSVLSEEGASGFSSLSQHSLSPELDATKEERVHSPMASITEKGLESSSKVVISKSVEMVTDSDTYFLNKDVPAQHLMRILQKDVGMLSSSADSSASDTSGKKELKNTDNPTSQGLIREGPPGEASVSQQQPQPERDSYLNESKSRLSEVFNVTVGSRSTQPDDSSEALRKELLHEAQKRSSHEAGQEQKSATPPLEFRTDISERKPSVTRVSLGNASWTGLVSTTVQQRHSDQALWLSENQTGIDGSYLGFLPQSQSTPGVFKPPCKSSVKAKFHQLSDIDSNKETSVQSHAEPSTSQAAAPHPEPENQSQKEPTCDKVQSLPSLTYMQKVDAWRANQSPGKTSLFDTLALHGFTGVSPKKKAYDAVSDNLNRILSQQVAKISPVVPQNTSTGVSGSSSPRREEAVGSAPSDKDNTWSAATQPASPLGRSQSHSSLSTVVMSVKKEQPEGRTEKEHTQAAEEVLQPPNTRPKLSPLVVSLGHFSDVTFSNSQGSSNSGHKLATSIGTSSVSLEVDNYDPYWTSKLSTPPPQHKTRDLNIEERIPLYLQNLGIDQSPSTILTPFTPRGPIREPEFSPTELCTIKGSTPTRSIQPSDGGTPHKAEFSRSSIQSVDSSLSIPLSQDSFSQALGPGLIRPASSSSETAAIQSDFKLYPNRDEDPSSQLQRDSSQSPDHSGSALAQAEDLESHQMGQNGEQNAEVSLVSSNAFSDIRKLLTQAEDMVSSRSSAASDRFLSQRKASPSTSLFTTEESKTQSSQLWARSSSDSVLTSRQLTVGENIPPATKQSGVVSRSVGLSLVLNKSVQRAEPEGCSAAPPDRAPPQPPVTPPPPSPPTVTTSISEEPKQTTQEGPEESSTSSPVPVDVMSDRSSDSSLAIRVAKLLQSESPATVVSSATSVDQEEGRAREWIKQIISGQQCEPLELDQEDRRRIEEIKRELLLKKPLKSYPSTDTESSAASSLRDQRGQTPLVETLSKILDTITQSFQQPQSLSTKLPQPNTAQGEDIEARVREIAAREGVPLPNTRALTSITISTCRRFASPSTSTSPVSLTTELLHLNQLTSEDDNKQPSSAPTEEEFGKHPETDVVLGSVSPVRQDTVGGPYEESSSSSLSSEQDKIKEGYSELIKRAEKSSITDSSLVGHETEQATTKTGHISHVRLTLSPKPTDHALDSFSRDVTLPQKHIVPLGQSLSAPSSPDEGVGLSSPPEWHESREQITPRRTDTGESVTQQQRMRSSIEVSVKPLAFEALVPHLLPYKPPGSELFYVPQAEADFSSTDTTIESTHTGSDDALPPQFSSDVFGHQDPGLDRGVTIRHTEGIYSKRLSKPRFLMHAPGHRGSSDATNEPSSNSSQTPEPTSQVAFTRVPLSSNTEAPATSRRDQGTSPVLFLTYDPPEMNRDRSVHLETHSNDHLKRDQGVLTSMSRRDQGTSPVLFLTYDPPEMNRDRSVHLETHSNDQLKRDQGVLTSTSRQNNSTLDELWLRFRERWSQEGSRPISDREASLLERLERLSRLIHSTRNSTVSDKESQQELHTPHKGDFRELRKHRHIPDKTNQITWEYREGLGQVEGDSQLSSPAERDASDTLSSTPGSMSTVDTARLVRAFGADRVQKNLRTSSSLSKLYTAIDKQKDGQDLRRTSHTAVVPVSETSGTDESSVVVDPASSTSTYTPPSHRGPSTSLVSKKAVRQVSRGIQAGHLEIVSNGTRRHTRDVGTTFPSPSDARGPTQSSTSSSLGGAQNAQRSLSSKTQKQRKNQKSSSKHYPEGISWFIPADELKAEARKENEPEEVSVWRANSVWFEPLQKHPWREPLRQRQVQDERNTQRSESDPGPRGKISSSLARVSLQDALLASRPEFVSRSRQRMERLALQVEERRLQVMFSSEREQFFSRPGRPGRLSRPAGTALLRRAVPKKEMIQRSKQIYENLPEVRRRKEEERRRAEYRSYRLNAQLYNKRITNRVLGRRTAWH